LNEAERRPRPWLDWLARAPELLPGLAALAVIVFWTTSDGGVFPTDSYPGALILLGLLAVTAFAFRAQLGALPGVVVAAIVVLAVFAFWNFLSITWADDQGAAWDGANRCLLYLSVFAIFAIPPWRSEVGATLMGVYALAIAVVGGVTLLQAAGSAHPVGYFVADRFANPLGYHNADAAAFTLALFPALFLASRRETPWPIRGLMLAAAGVLFQLALLPQSRGWLIAAPLALLAYLVLVPRLLRSLITLVPLGIVCALTAPTMLNVFDALNAGGDLPGALDDARTAMLVGAAVLFVAGVAIGLADRAVELPDSTIATADRVTRIVAGAAALAGVVAALAVIGNPASWASDRWHDFKSGEFEHSFSGSRLGQGLGSNRYDFWRVAAHEFTAHPLIGVGSDNFAEDYVRDRHSPEEPTYPHNVPLQIISETGVIGGLLFGSFLVLSLIGVGRVRLRGSPLARGVAGVTAVMLIYWLVHSFGDWFWAFPALTAPVFAWLGMGMRLDAVRAPASRSSWGCWSLAGTTAAVAVGVVAAVSLFLPWAAALDVRKAAHGWGADPQAAFDRLDQARDLNFLSAQPDLVEGAIAVQLGDRERIRSSFTGALERDPRNWYATLQLAALDGVEGHWSAALQRLDRVAELNPREPEIATVRNGIVSGHPVSPASLDAAFVARACQRLGRNPDPNGGCK
jgi:O-Antigen ligase